jgi:hypothetical protein
VEAVQIRKIGWKSRSDARVRESDDPAYAVKTVSKRRGTVRRGRSSPVRMIRAGSDGWVMIQMARASRVLKIDRRQDGSSRNIT